MSKINCKATVSCLVRCGAGLVVVQETQDGVLAWDIPAGGVESNETPERAIIRELKEEIGLSLSIPPTLTQIYWQAGDYPVVNFLFSVNIDDKTALTLKAEDPDILNIDVFTPEQINQIITTNAYEHELAKARLNEFLNGHTGSDILNII